jgi:hypothetical protein
LITRNNFKVDRGEWLVKFSSFICMPILSKAHAPHLTDRHFGRAYYAAVDAARCDKPAANQPPSSGLRALVFDDYPYELTF